MSESENLLAGEPISSESGICSVCEQKAEVRIFYKVITVPVNFFETISCCRNCFVGSPSLEGFSPVLCDTSFDCLGIGIRGVVPSYRPTEEEQNRNVKERKECEGKWYQSPVPLLPQH